MSTSRSPPTAAQTPDELAARDCVQRGSNDSVAIRTQRNTSPLQHPIRLGPVDPEVAPGRKNPPRHQSFSSPPPGKCSAPLQTDSPRLRRVAHQTDGPTLGLVRDQERERPPSLDPPLSKLEICVSPSSKSLDLANYSDFLALFWVETQSSASKSVA
ncbi:MAG: hypothetical protein CM1200mP9_00020 [Gammaproteobacteria bacterium]|nr:MAG: hypothetical protein CM1200mP9_00020 [Gammaproteobacteria bacterium]